jgi:hypothetical protein
MRIMQAFWELPRMRLRIGFAERQPWHASVRRQAIEPSGMGTSPLNVSCHFILGISACGSRRYALTQNREFSALLNPDPSLPMAALRGYSGARLSIGYRHDCPRPRGGGGGRRPGGMGFTCFLKGWRQGRGLPLAPIGAQAPSGRTHRQPHPMAIKRSWRYYAPLISRMMNSRQSAL